MTSVNVESKDAVSAMQSALQVEPQPMTEETPPEVVEFSKTCFKMIGSKIVVTLKTKTDKPIQFVIGSDKFLMGITGMVAFMNLHLRQFFDLIGGP